MCDGVTVKKAPGKKMFLTFVRMGTNMTQKIERAVQSKKGGREDRKGGPKQKR